MTDRDPASFTPKDIAIAMTALAPFVSIPEADDAVAVAIIVPVAVSDADVDTMLAGLEADLRGGGHGQREQRSTRQDENQLYHSNLLCCTITTPEIVFGSQSKYRGPAGTVSG
jgi:hypothetical protein